MPDMTPAPSKRTKYKQVLSEFNQASAAIIPDYDALSGPQKTAVLNTLENWGAATDADRITALHALCALQQKALDYLVQDID